jgi:hypothetical protein
MQYDLVIERVLREAQDLLRANLPPTQNLPDDRAVASLRAAISAPAVQQAIERGNDTALSFVLRAANRILSDTALPPRTTLNGLWCILDDPELNRALGVRQSSRLMPGRKKPPAR